MHMNKVESDIVAREKIELAASLQKYIGIVPASFQYWGHMKTVDFKSAYRKTEDALNQKNKSISKMRSALSSIRSFHEETLL